MGKLENGKLIDDGGASEDELVVDIEEKLAIESAKQKLLLSPPADLQDGSQTPSQTSSHSVLEQPLDEEESKKRDVSSTLPDRRGQKQISRKTSAQPTTGLISGPGFNSMIIESPSFTPTAAVPGPGFNSMVIESPSFTPPSSASNRTPAVMSETVREAVPRPLPSSRIATSSSKATKVSRFKAARS
jgi:hypothetical protein